MRLIAFLFLGLGCVAPAFADSFLYTFAIIPSDGEVSGNVADTIGWGYEIDNLDPNNWLVTTNLDAGSFSGAAATSVFDFPILTPGEDLIVPLDPVAGTGLYEVVWDAGTALGSSNQGVFTLSADWYDGDPTARGNYIESARDQLQSYTVTLGSPSAPEPASAGLFLLGLASLWASSRPASESLNHARKILQVCLILGLIVLPSREGNDASTTRGTNTNLKPDGSFPAFSAEK